MTTFVGEYDLRGSRDRLWGVDGYGCARILLRDGPIPVGTLSVGLGPGEVALERSRIEEEAERQLGVNLALLRMRGTRPPPERQLPNISVVVCTRDRPGTLARCLRSLGQLAYESHEVIVVDNAPSGPRTAELVSTTPFRYVLEDRAGLNRARNRGASEARHSIIAYVDDDVVVDPGWLHGIAGGFRTPEASMVTGLVLPVEMETRAQHLFELYGSGMSKGLRERLFQGQAMPPHELIPVHAVGVGANMALRREALEEIGGFDPALDVGTPASGAGDLDVFHRILVEGGTIRYEPQALVWHQHRRDMASLRQQLYDNGRSYGVYLLKLWQAGRIPKRSLLHHGLWQWGRWLAGRPVLRLLHRHRLPMSLLLAELWGASHAPFAYRKTYRAGRLGDYPVTSPSSRTYEKQERDDAAMPLEKPG
jgi:glycosyltransferase involved in cell wall biosynthesis